ncbi:ATP-binding protein [Streptomyces similanensis]|uniref:ATP-binding protein n=1 Tax=Streptomyces similanensis TaxID=1274988 RepID=A0ABP9KH54_9ACTN
MPSAAEAAAHARKFVREVLAADDQPLGAECVDAVLLIASELVTNAFRYGSEPGDSLLVVVLTTADRVRVEVHDPVRRRPAFREEAGTRVRGRGLHIVDTLATRWDVDDRPLGKAVWAEVAR